MHRLLTRTFRGRDVTEVYYVGDARNVAALVESRKHQRTTNYDVVTGVTPPQTVGSLHLSHMIATPQDLRTTLSNAVAAYEASGNMGVLMERLHTLRDSATADALVAAVEPWREMPEVAGPIYERVVAEQPSNARALVILANAYWLSGRGAEVVGALADRAIASDPTNRGAWHMWALTESNQRDRTIRWIQVTERFPEDQLAKAALADNAASLASAEHDKEAMQLAITTYEQLLASASSEQQRQALETALTTLRKWTL